MDSDSDFSLQQAYGRHERHWHKNAYCYPVVSRRSGGLSIGLNLNPDTACNFDCIYCQVDRSRSPVERKVDLSRLEDELGELLDTAGDGSLFADPPFDCLQAGQRRICDIAFSGDGEPTTFPRFNDAVWIAVEARRAHRLNDTKLVLITDACYLTQPRIAAGLALLDENNGEIWAKLDAGTEDYYQLVNRPNFPLSHVLSNILTTAQSRPIVIQSMWMKVHGRPPPEDELSAFAGHINDILTAGGQIKLIQVYTIARQTAEPYATALSRGELDDVVANIVRSLAVPLETYYGLQA